MFNIFPSFGELFITNDEVSGSMENLKVFKGKLITNICGGCKKLFIIEDGGGDSGVISTLHQPENDNYDDTFTIQNQAPNQDALQAFDNKGSINKIVTGKKHTVFTTQDGQIYSYGFGEYGALGHGGLIQTMIPKQINRLVGRPVDQVACGEYHTIVLTKTRDMYAWGRGFEGQLGIRKDVDTSSVPMFVPYFYKNPAVQIACGAYHSLAIDANGKLYGWGEGRFGQLGKGQILKEQTPILINLTLQQQNAEKEEYDQYRQMIEARRESKIKRKQLLQSSVSDQFDNDINNNNDNKNNNNDTQQTIPVQQQSLKNGNKTNTYHKNQFQESKPQSQFKINPLTNLETNPFPKIMQVQGGYGHTVCLTESGDLYAWGFNQRGQLGLGDRRSRYFPQKITQDLLGNQIPQFRKIICGYYTTYAIDQNGQIWSWGGGNLGHKGDRLCDLPRKVVDNTENRNFGDMIAISNQAVFFAQLQIISARPNYGPSCGGTIISLIGTGFCDTGRQSVRFTFGQKYVFEVACIYDEMTDSFSCSSPNFEEITEDQEQNWPQECNIEVTLDGNVYIASKTPFLIYSSKINMETVYPKCASVEGGTTLTVNINIDEKTSAVMKHLNIGFQPRTKKDKQDANHNQNLADKTPSQLEQDLNSRRNNLISARDIDEKQSKNQLNPLDISTNDPELEKENWICVEGIYEKGKISCIVPNISKMSCDALNYSVDVSINGQQFTGNPLVFRFYDIKVSSMIPDTVLTNGGTTIKITGEGFFDTTNKKIILKTKFGERLIDIQWDKKERSYSLVAPPITWLLGGQAPTEQLLNDLKDSGVETLMTLNGVEWIQIGKLNYKDPEPIYVEPVITEEERLLALKAEKEALKHAQKKK